MLTSLEVYAGPVCCFGQLQTTFMRAFTAPPPPAQARLTLARMFDSWESHPTYRTLIRVGRRVYVDMYKAIPGCVGGFVRNRNISLRAEGLYLEAWMPGEQLAWIRTHDLHWIGVVQVCAHSSNGRSTITMTLWLPPEAFQIERPAGLHQI